MEREKLVELLQELEWASRDENNWDNECPSCYAPKTEGQHDAGCGLKEALDQLRLGVSDCGGPPDKLHIRADAAFRVKVVRYEGTVLWHFDREEMRSTECAGDGCPQCERRRGVTTRERAVYVVELRGQRRKFLCTETVARLLDPVVGKFAWIHRTGTGLNTTWTVRGAPNG